MVAHSHFSRRHTWSKLWVGALVTAASFSVLIPMAFILTVRDAQLMSLAGLITAASLAVVPHLVHSREANERHLTASKLMGPMAALMTICIWALLRELQIPAMDPSTLRLLVFAVLAIFLAVATPLVKR